MNTQQKQQKIKKSIDNETKRVYNSIVNETEVKKMVQRYQTLKSILVKKEIKQQELADAINMDRTTLSAKINRYQGRDFTLDEARAISEFIKEPIDNFF